LIVVNNFQYDGDLNNINPNEIESITILKDAAAASIWGAKAGNGVIVIVLKKARSGPPQLVYHSAVGIQARPDLSNIHSISSCTKRVIIPFSATHRIIRPFRPGSLSSMMSRRGFFPLRRRMRSGRRCGS
jgi:TonB-dependent SusC/RagA subfamily outer membrane receptor